MKGGGCWVSLVVRFKKAKILISNCRTYPTPLRTTQDGAEVQFKVKYSTKFQKVGSSHLSRLSWPFLSLPLPFTSFLSSVVAALGGCLGALFIVLLHE